LDRIANALLPMKIPDQDITHNYNTFYVHAYNIQIESIDFYLKPGDNVLLTRLFFSGVFQINIQFDVPVINKHVDIPIPIPLDKLSHYLGKISPSLTIDPASDPNGQVHVHLVPNVKFLDEWYIFLLTDYRDFLANFIQDWVNRFAEDFFILRFLRHIPIIGWILGKVINMTGWALGYLLGAFLDYVVSTWLNLLINVLGRAAIAIWYRPDFDVYQLPQSKLKDLAGLVIQAGEIAVVDNGRNADLEVRLLFEQGAKPVPTVGVIDPVRPPHAPVETLPPVDGIIHLPEYTENDFQPILQLPAPNFGTLTQRFRVTVLLSNDTPQSITGTLTVTYYKDNDRWNIQRSTTIADAGTETTTITYDDSLRVKHLDSSVGTAIGLSYHLTGEVDWAVKTITIIEQDEQPKTLANYSGVDFEFLEFWVYRLAYTDLTTFRSGKLSRLSTKSKYEVVNWLRIIPLEIKSLQSSTISVPNPIPGGPALNRSLYTLQAIDDEGSYQVQIFKEGGLYAASFKQNDATLSLQSI